MHHSIEYSYKNTIHYFQIKQSFEAKIVICPKHVLFQAPGYESIFKVKISLNVAFFFNKLYNLWARTFKSRKSLQFWQLSSNKIC